MKAALFLRRIGPYHHARFKAAAKRMDLHVVETRPVNQEYPWEFEPGSEYAQYRFCASSKSEKGIRGNTLKNKVKAVLDEIQPQVIVTVGWADAEYHAVLLESEKRKIPVSVISDSTFFGVKRYRAFEWLKRQIVGKFGSALAAGIWSKEYLARLGMDENKIYFPWDVVDNDLFSQKVDECRRNANPIAEYGSDGPFLVCIARFIPEKNLGSLIRAYKQYVDGRVEKKQNYYLLLIVGSGPLFDSIKKAVFYNNLQDKIFLTGFIQQENLFDFYANAKWLILPSQSETWGLVVNEAFACGLPAIVSKQCGCSDDLVIDGETGYLYDSHNVVELCRLLTYIHDISDGKYASMKAKCKSKIAEYSLSAFAEGLASTVANSKNRSYNFIGRLFSAVRIYLP